MGKNPIFKVQSPGSSEGSNDNRVREEEHGNPNASSLLAVPVRQATEPHCASVSLLISWVMMVLTSQDRWKIK